MMWARLIGSAVFLAAGLGGARSANESMMGLESCFQVARIADAICSKLPNDPARPDCFQKTRSAQLECLEHVLSETPAGSPTSKLPFETTRPEPAGNPSAEKSNIPPKPIVRASPPELPTSSEAPAGAVRPAIPPRTAEVPVRPTGTSWVVSETTSPIDYSPLLTAVIRATSPVKDAPSALAVRCRKHHTELVIRTDGIWATTRSNEVRIEYQINDQPAVGLPWILSSDGKSATYKEDPVGFLQSLPDGARLKINVADRSRSSHEAMFRFDGWDAVRKKIRTTCKWTSAASVGADTSRANTTDSRATGSAVTSSTTRTIQEQVAAATAVAERMTVAIIAQAPEPKANDKDHSETVLRGDAETAQPTKTDFMVYLLMARPEIKSISDLTSKIVAIDGHSASDRDVRIAIAAAGAPKVQVSDSQTRAIDRVISGEVPAAILTLVSSKAADGFPNIAGFKIFRIPLAPDSSTPRP